MMPQESPLPDNSLREAGAYLMQVQGTPVPSCATAQSPGGAGAGSRKATLAPGEVTRLSQSSSNYTSDTCSHEQILDTSWLFADRKSLFSPAQVVRLESPEHQERTAIPGGSRTVQHQTNPLSIIHDPLSLWGTSVLYHSRGDR